MMDARIQATIQITARSLGITETIIAEAIQEVARVLAEIAEQPYSDEVQAFGTDEPLAVGKKIAKAILTAVGIDKEK